MSLSRPLRHTSTTLTTASYYDHEEDPTLPPATEDEPWLFRLLNRAAAFGEVISQHPTRSPSDKSSRDEDDKAAEGADVMGLLGHDLASMAIAKPARGETSDLERRSSSWCNGAPERWTKLSVSSWLKGRKKNHGLAGSSGSDSDEEEHRPSETRPPPDDEPTPIVLEGEKLSEEPEAITPSPAATPVTEASEAPPLTSQEKVALIVSEFGALADGEEEVLLAETDASFFQDVAILGVLHLTTHRIAFHASLLSARPDLAPAKQILHAGPAVVRKGKLRRRRRVWMELSHDMITTFRSSEEHERVRPLRTVLLSAFRKIYPLDYRHPRVVKIEFSSAGAPNPPSKAPHFSTRSFSRSWTGSPGGGRTKQSAHKQLGDDDDTDAEGDGDSSDVVKDIVEFDTEEAAMGWRREVQAALYMFRLHRRKVLEQPSDADTDEGVRISIPLARIQSHQVHGWDNLATVLQLDLGSHATGPTQAGGFGVGLGDMTGVTSCVGAMATSGPLIRGWSVPKPPTKSLSLDSESDDQQSVTEHGAASTKLQFALLQSSPTWARFGEILARAQARPPPKEDPGAVVDFGPLTFVEPGLDTFDPQDGARVGEVARGSREKEVRRVFGLGDDLDIWITKCSLHRVVSTSGLLVVSTKFVCFWSRLLAASDVKIRFHTEDVRAAAPARVWCRGSGLTLQVYGHSDMLFEFSRSATRDEAIQRISALVSDRPVRPERLSSRTDSLPSTTPSSTHPSSVSTDSATALLSPLSRTLAQLRERKFPPAMLAHLAKPINVPDGIPYGLAPRHFICLTIGSRGDVQPYIALGRGLQAAGHRVTIVTHEEYKAWIEGWGITHRTAGGDPGALMKLNVEHKMFSPQFFKESIGHFRTWIDQLLLDAWEQCKDADVLIESPPAMAGVHIAEALNIPYFRAFTMPWSKTAQYPHPFISPPVENSARFNTASYVLFDNVFWLGTSGQINKWRKKHLGLPTTDMGHMAQAKIPFVYNFSPSVVPKPLDWGDQITVSGYWFLDNPDLGWTPSDALRQFIAQARADDKPLVYIGFGSITVPHASAMTRSIVKAVLKSDVRAILSKGWSSRMDKDEAPEVELPPEIFAIDKAPHDWLFPQMAAVLHHGGAGTTGASLRAGIPTLIKPWFGDQFFWASRVQKLGAGLKVASLRSADLADALKKATTDRNMQEKAAAVGEKIRQENGVPTAIKAIYTYLDRAGKVRTTLK